MPFPFVPIAVGAGLASLFGGLSRGRDESKYRRALEEDIQHSNLVAALSRGKLRPQPSAQYKESGATQLLSGLGKAGSIATNIYGLRQMAMMGEQQAAQLAMQKLQAEAMKRTAQQEIGTAAAQQIPPGDIPGSLTIGPPPGLSDIGKGAFAATRRDIGATTQAQRLAERGMEATELRAGAAWAQANKPSAGIATARRKLATTQAMVNAVLEEPQVFRTYSETDRSKVLPYLVSHQAFDDPESPLRAVMGLNLPNQDKQDLVRAGTALNALYRVQARLIARPDLLGAIAETKGLAPAALSAFTKERQALQSDLDLATQMFGSFTEKGVLREGDWIKYQKIVGGLGDQADVAISRVNNIIDAVNRDIAFGMTIARKQGYYVPDILEDITIPAADLSQRIQSEQTRRQ